ncbi:concanavalin A-like lectin/glucanase [Stipitochalara longipes BDJ]|nr:concanavalin A-like lectin/glucanase [Stipitochalara longipes BDJ]
MKLPIFLSSLLLVVAVFAAPQSKENLTRRSRISPLHGKTSPLKNVTNNPVDGSTNWSGAAVFPAPSGTFTSIQGQFTIPVPTLPSRSAPGSYYVSIWVGIDGLGSNDVFQAGVIIETDLKSDGSTDTSYFPWYECYPLPLSVIDGFPANPGDEIFISLTEVSSSVGNLLFENLSQGVGAQGDVPSPTPSADLQGISVEWIVEDPSDGTSLVPFSDFGMVVFTNCVAETSTGTSVNLADSTLLSLITDSGGMITSILTDETLLSDTSVEVVYAGP